MAGLCLALAACSAFRPGKSSDEAYRDIRQGETLEMSPGLVQSATQSEQLRIANSTLLPIIKGAQVMNDGSNYYASISASPEITWERLIAFLDRYSFKIVAKDNLSGLIETDWRPARSDQSGAVSRVGNRIKGLFGSGEAELMEKFIFRLARADQGSRLYVSHRRGERKNANAPTTLLSDGGDNQIEAAILNRFLIFLGFGENASPAPAPAPVPVAAPEPVPEPVLKTMPDTLPTVSDPALNVDAEPRSSSPLPQPDFAPTLSTQAAPSPSLGEDGATSFPMPEGAIAGAESADPQMPMATAQTVDVPMASAPLSSGGFSLNLDAQSAFPAVEAAARELGFRVFASQPEKGLMGLKAGLTRDAQLAGYPGLVGEKRWKSPELIVQITDQGAQSGMRVMRRDKTSLSDDASTAFLNAIEQKLR